MIDTSSNHDNINPITILNSDITYEEVKSLLITFFDRLISFLVIFQMSKMDRTLLFVTRLVQIS